MTKNSVIPFKNPDQIEDPLTDLLKAGARQLIQQAVEAELQVLLEQHQYCLTEDGKAAVVRNGYHPERNIQTGIDPGSFSGSQGIGVEAVFTTSILL